LEEVIPERLNALRPKGENRMAQLTALPAVLRELGGKSALLRLRQQGKIPAVMFGRATENTPIALDAKMFEQFVKRHGPSGIVELQIGADRGAAVIKEVQRHPITGRVLHLDLQRISMQDRITAAVPLVLVGDASAVKDQGGIIEQHLSELSVSCQADHLPDQIAVDISGLQIGHSIHVSDLTFPEGVEPAQSPDTVVAAAAMTAAGRGLSAAEAAEEEAKAEAAETAAAPAEEVAAE
jgi:large subunit ribosomal protein L25